MQEAGWDLTLVARQPTIELAGLAGLRAQPVTIGMSPYSKASRHARDPFASERKAVSASELVFFGPTQPSFLEEQLAESLSSPKLAGFVLDEDFWPSEGIADPRAFAQHLDIRITVKNSDREPERNARAATTLLGRRPVLPPFQFPATLRARWIGRGPAESYVVVCAGYREGDYYKGLGTERWTSELRAIEAGHRFVFVGAPAEAKSHAAILSGLHNPDHHIDLTGKLTSLSDLMAVLENAEAYVGKDSGTMHLAAAVNKPVVAVFGGGHWSRFLPTGVPAVILTTRVPCRGCDWRCHFNEPICATGLAAGSVAEAWTQLGRAEPDQPLILEAEPFPHHAEILRNHPSDNYPQKVHLERRRRLSAEREQALQPAWRKLWNRMTPSRG